MTGLGTPNGTAFINALSGMFGRVRLMFGWVALEAGRPFYWRRASPVLRGRQSFCLEYQVSSVRVVAVSV